MFTSIQAFLLLATVLSCSAQTTTMKSLTPAASAGVPPLSPQETAICEGLKPKDSGDFVKGSGTFSLKLKFMVKDKFVWVQLKGENKTTFEGNSKRILITKFLMCLIYHLILIDWLN